MRNKFPDRKSRTRITSGVSFFISNLSILSPFNVESNLRYNRGRFDYITINTRMRLFGIQSQLETSYCSDLIVRS